MDCYICKNEVKAGEVFSYNNYDFSHKTCNKTKFLKAYEELCRDHALQIVPTNDLGLMVSSLAKDDNLMFDAG